MKSESLGQNTFCAALRRTLGGKDETAGIDAEIDHTRP